MPLVRYFLFAGAMLLGLLFLADLYLPKPADAVTADIDRSVIRIHTTQRWPAAVQIDTSAPIPRIISLAAASATPLPASIREAKAYVPADAATSFETSKPSGKTRQHTKRLARSSPPQTYPHLAAVFQSNWSYQAR